MIEPIGIRAGSRWRGALSTALVLVWLGAAPAAVAGPPEKAFELGIAIPLVLFDEDSAIQDNQGEDDKIDPALGFGAIVGYRFRKAHSVDFTYYQANSKSEDMQGDNFFHIRTQQYALDYTRSWDIKEYLAAFVTAGAGGFRAEPMEVNHVDRSGWSGFIGGGLEIMPESRSSLRLGVGRARVRMDDGKADNFYFTLSSVWYVGVGKPSPSSPPPAAPPG